MSGAGLAGANAGAILCALAFACGCGKERAADADAGGGTATAASETRAARANAAAAVEAPDASARAAGKPLNVTPLPVASVAAFVNPDGLPPYEGATGIVEGRVMVTGPPSPDTPPQNYTRCPEAAIAYKKLFREGPRTADAGPDGARALGDAIVGVIGYKGFFVPETREARTAKIEQCAFTERTIDMTLGQRLEITNASHVLFAPTIEQQKTAALMVTAAGTKDAIKLYPTRPGHMTLIDGTGIPFLNADLYVFLHPLHAVTKLDGTYRIEGVPVGRRKVFARHITLHEETAADVDVRAGVVEHVDLILSYHPGAVADAGPAPAPGGFLH
jgi:hypothetical protein